MNTAQMIISFAGGLGLFIFGMQLMANGLQKAAGKRMKNLLAVLTKNRLVGVLVGALVTAIIQSSSATTVMVVGFVNAGIMDLVQAVGIIIGANIGTTATAWIVSSIEWAKFLNPSNVAPLVLAIGVVMSFAKKSTVQRTGEILVGFGVLFIGINMMTSAVSPLRESELFREVFVKIGSNPLLGILTGALVTGIIQSSSASVGILQALALTGLVPWNAAVYIIMGQNIGTCVTALLSSIGANKTAKSAAMIHLLFNVIGTVVFSIIAIVYFVFINPLFGENLINSTEISIVHTSFNVATTILLFPFANSLISIATKIIGTEKTVKPESELHLDIRLLETPAFAIQCAISEIVRMGYYVLDTYEEVVSALKTREAMKVQVIFDREDSINKMDSELTVYLVKICGCEISKTENKNVTSLFHTVNDIERVGDGCKNIAELIDYHIRSNITFSSTAKEDLNEIMHVTGDCLRSAIKSLEENDADIAEKVVKYEDTIDKLKDKLRESHLQRLTANQCDPVTGVIFLDIVEHLERISDQALNIAQYVLAQPHAKK